jgi:hypothetical protein
MITIYYHCIGMTEADEKFLKNSLQELAQRLKAEPIKLEINIRRLRDEPELTKKVDGKLNLLSDPSYMFSQCEDEILNLFFEEGFVKGDFSPKLLVYCSKDSQVAMAALRQKSSAQWGATCSSLAAVYTRNNKFAIWHEAVHSLLSREDDLDECYEPDPLHERKTDCDCESCLMHYEPSEQTVGEWPSLCSKVIKLLQELGNKERGTT